MQKYSMEKNDHTNWYIIIISLDYYYWFCMQRLTVNCRQVGADLTV